LGVLKSIKLLEKLNITQERIYAHNDYMPIIAVILKKRNILKVGIMLDINSIKFSVYIATINLISIH
jgi:hypothetical protein